MKKFLLIVIAMIVLFSQISHSATVTLPVPQDVLTRVTLSIQKLQDLLKYFNTFYENKYLIYQRVQLTKKYLLELSKSLAQYNNVIAGSGNSVNGSKNIVIGNYDNIEGSNNWVFVSQFTGKINGDLLIGIWRIELDKAYLIPVNTRFAISYLDQSRNAAMKKKYGAKSRQICKWDKWTHPENTKTDTYWKKFGGYNDWKNEYQKANTTNTNTWGNWGNWGSWGPGTWSWGSGR